MDTGQVTSNILHVLLRNYDIIKRRFQYFIGFEDYVDSQYIWIKYHI